MKKYKPLLITATISLFFSIGLLNAQTQKGTIYIGASAGLGSAFGETSGESNTIAFGVSSNNGVNGNKKTAFGLSPHIGYFIENNLMAGLNLNVYSSSNDMPSNTENLMRLGPALRWYGGEGKFRATMEASVLVGASKNGNTKYSHLGFSGGPGIAWLLNERMSLDLQALAEYDSSKLKNQDEHFAAHRFGFRVGIGVFL